MRSEWITSTIDDICKLVTDGAHNSPKSVDNGYYMASVKDFTAYGFDFSNCRKISEADYLKLKKQGCVPESGDILVGKDGARYFEDVIIYRQKEQPALLSSIAILRVDDTKVTSEFLYYTLKSPTVKKDVRDNYGSGSAIPRIVLKDFKRMPISFPSLKEQKKITNICVLLDEKIQLNNRINKNLEQQAKAIFKSWFVDFEPFGGVQPSEMQFIPLQELCKVVTKGTTPTTLGKSFTSSGINFIKAESILDNHSIDSSKFAFVDEETNALLKRSVIKANDIIFTIAGTLGRFAMVDNSVLPANTNQAVAIIRPDEAKITPAYLYSFFIGNWHNEYYSKRIQQAVQANLSLTTIKSLPIAVLNNTTMSNYDKLVSPLFALMKNNEEENRRLSKLRDVLLPKLMSGEIDVSNIEL